MFFMEINLWSNFGVKIFKKNVLRVLLRLDLIHELLINLVRMLLTL